MIPGVIHISKSSLDKTKGTRLARKAVKNAFQVLAESAEPEELYGSIHMALNTFICAKMGQHVERSSREMVEWINITTNKKSITDEFQNILNRADAVRFANITVEESKKDIKDFKELLVNLDRVC